MTQNPDLILGFYGGTGSVTGANFGLFDQAANGKNILVDCGLIQGSQISPKENYLPFAFRPAQITALFVTHAHLDHIGRIPKLVQSGFQGTIYSTAPTRAMSELSLIDSLGVMTKESRSNKRDLLYQEADVKQAMSQWQTIDYHQPVTVGRGEFTLLNAGHILGSAMVSANIANRQIIFTGDLGNTPATLLPPPETVTQADFMIIESVYGDRTHEGQDTRRTHLQRVITKTMAAGGTLMIPAFSIERTQELLLAIEELMSQSKIPVVPVYLDSPLAIGMTDIYSRFTNHLKSDLKAQAKQSKLFSFPQLIRTKTTEESKAIIQAPARKIIIAGSGMSNGGRILHHEKNYLPDPKSTLLLVGYQAPGSLGRLLVDGAKTVKIMGQEVSVNARIETISGYSAHMDSPALLEFVAESADSLRQVFVTMGEPKSSLFLAQRIKDYLDVEATVPQINDEVDLSLI